MKKLSTLLFISALVTVLFSACRKPEPPKGVVLVVDQEEQVVWGADVFLHAYDVAFPGQPGDSIVVRNGVTDSFGKFYFEVENPCVLTIEAWSLETLTDTATGTTYKDTIYGTASIRLEMDETTEQKVILRP